MDSERTWVFPAAPITLMKKSAQLVCVRRWVDTLCSYAMAPSRVAGRERSFPPRAHLSAAESPLSSPVLLLVLSSREVTDRELMP